MTSDFTMPGTTSSLRMDGLTIRFVTSAATDGVPIFMTAPWPESLYAFNFVWDRISAVGPVTAVDLPGFGMSQGRADLMSPVAMGQFLVGLMDEFHIERAHVVAPDVGTLAVLFAASSAPQRFASIIGGSGGVSLPLLGEPLRQIVDSSRNDFADIDGGDRVYGFVKSGALSTISETILEDYRASSRGQRWNEAADFVRAYRSDLPRLETLLPSIQTPTLVISGQNDPLVPPSNGQFLADRMPHCRAEVVSAGHFVWEDAADSYASLVVDWIRQRHSRI